MTKKQLLIAILLLAMTACQGKPLQPQATSAELTFDVAFEINSGSEWHITLSVRNDGNVVFDGDEAFNAIMDLHHQDNEPRARMEIAEINAIAPHDVIWIAGFRGQLEAGAYELIWGAPGYGYTEVAFEVVEREGRVELGEVTKREMQQGTPPVAADYGDAAPLIEQAINELQAAHEVARSDITVLRVERVQFPDASLGVPEPGQMYAQVVTPGYIIELVAGGVVYEYRGSGDRIVLAPGENDGDSDSITIESVQVTSDQVVFVGRSTLPEGTCLQTQLFADDDPEPWWPADICATVQDGTWQIAVSLDEGEAPGELDPSVQYMLRAWQKDAPTVESVFWFDLDAPPSGEQGAYRRVEIPDVGLALEVPSNWQRLDPEWAWSPDDTGDLRIGIKWADIQPPMEPEAVLLPQSAQVLDSEPVTLNWGNGRRFTVEVYGPATQGGDTQAPVQSVETHVLVTTGQGDITRVFDFYASGQTAEQLASLTASLQYMLDTATLNGAS